MVVVHGNSEQCGATPPPTVDRAALVKAHQSPPKDGSDSVHDLPTALHLCVRLRQAGIPECISPQPVPAAAMADSSEQISLIRSTFP